MGLIKQLPEIVSNQISAGEVIERPASIVKELVENSIDAGSTRIFVEIENGGRDRVRIRDNGSGIAGDDIELAFARYATSKIDNVNDLYSIRTLGFRGEALASIASISKVKITSRTKDSMKGTFMNLKGGEVIKKEAIGTQVGTDIIVEDIFYNTPARYKYLKTINTEFGHISNIINREALAYPDIQFRLVHNNNEVLKTPGTGKLLDTIYSIYGQEMVDNLIPLDYEESYVKLNGYIAKPEFSRSSRIYQLFFVNNRSVYNRCLNRGVEKGYHGLLPSNRHPVIIVKLKLNQILVDVNVHPTKREVLFSREEIIENVLKKGIKNTLEKINPAPQFKRHNTKKMNDKKREKNIRQLDFNQKSFGTKDNSGIEKDLNNHRNLSNGYSIDTNSSTNKDNNINPSYGSNNKQYKDNEDIIQEDNNYLSVSNDQSNNKTGKTNKKYSNFYFEDGDQKKKNTKKNIDDKNFVNEDLPGNVKKIFGQIDNTYILLEGIDGLYIIDQHNAHERVLYESYYDKYNNQNIITQSLLVPVTIEVTLEEKEIVNKYISQMSDIGIKIEPFGSSSFIIIEIPNFIKNLPSKQIVRDIIDNLIKKEKTMQQAEMIDNIITYMSCRGAIKAGKHLDEIEMEKLVIDLFSVENSYRCPHGRPIIVHMSNDDIAKSMGR